MILNYNKTKKLVWTPEGETAYKLIRDQIRACPILFFLDPNAPIYLHTDACDYGIGAYLFQIIDGIDRPIQFMSRSLSGPELRWSTIEKECYAIVFALKRMAYLIRDTFFTLRTDHNNLIYINSEPSSKVARWKLLIQEYDFQIEYIPGPDNFVADALSRIVPFEGTEEELFLLEQFNIPKDKYKLISSIHNSHVGHFGVEKTLARLIEINPHTGAPRNAPWPNMREHVKRFLKRCPICQKLSQQTIIVQTQNFTTATSEPMERIAIDSLGPLEIDELGMMYIIVIIDCFTRWVELYAAPDATAQSAARVVMSHMGRFGQASQMISDNGTQYVNETIKEVLELLGTEHIRTVAYSHEENAIVERANKEIMRHLRALVFDQRTYKHWSNNIPIVQRIMNTMVHESIGVSPAQLLFGTAITLDTETYVPVSLRTSETQLSEWATGRLEQQRILIESAQAAQKTRDETNTTKRVLKRFSDSDKDQAPNKIQRRPTTITDDFAVGSYVLVSYPDNSLGKGRAPHKLMMPQKGPYQVVEKLRGIYTLRDLATNVVTPFNAHLLRPYAHDPLNDDPRDVAMHEKQEFDVEKIISHDGDTTRVSTLQFLVKWKDFDDSHNSWEPWKELRNNPSLFKYLAKKKLHQLIPKEHRA